MLQLDLTRSICNLSFPPSDDDVPSSGRVSKGVSAHAAASQQENLQLQFSVRCHHFHYTPPAVAIPWCPFAQSLRSIFVETCKFAHVLKNELLWM